MPDKFELEAWLPVIKLAAWGLAAIVAAFGGTGALVETTAADLQASEAKAGTVGRVVEARAETSVAYDDFTELVRYHAAREAACDAALEGFARHRDDDRDFAHALEECHSEGGID